MKCPSCSSVNPADALFCEHCGQSLQGVCPRCATANSPGARFCRRCGTRLPSPDDIAPPSPADLLASLQQSAPVALKEKMIASGAHLDGARKPVTILFTDIVGSTALAENLDPEEWRDIVQGAHRCVSDSVYR